MNHPTNHKRLYSTIIIVFFAIVAISLIAVSFAYASIRPIIYGICIAYIFKPMCNLYNKWFYLLYSKKFSIRKSKKAAHVTSIVCTYLTWAVILYLFLSFVLTQLITDIVAIAENMPELIGSLNTSVNKLLSEYPVLMKYYNLAIDEVAKYITSNTDKITGMVGDLANGVISGVIGTVTFIFNLCVGLIVSVYILIGRRKLGAQAKLITKSVFNKNISDLIIEEVKFADKMFSKYFVGSIIDSILVGVVCFVGCWIFGIPNMVLVSVIIGVTNIIPFFGPYIGLVPSAVIVFAHEPIKAVILIIMMLIVQQIDGNIVAPKIQGANTGLSSFWVLFAILLFGGLFGFVGMIIAVPIFAVIYDIFGKLMRFCLQKRGEDEELNTYEKEYLTFDDEEASIFKRKMAEWKEEYKKKKSGKRTAIIESIDSDSGETSAPKKSKSIKSLLKQDKKKPTKKQSAKTETVGDTELTQITFSDQVTDENNKN